MIPVTGAVHDPWSADDGAEVILGRRDGRMFRDLCHRRRKEVRVRRVLPNQAAVLGVLTLCRQRRRDD